MTKLLLTLLIFTNILFAQTITVTGYGNTKDEALKSAFQNAVEQEIGVLVDTKTVIKNGKLIKNKILTFSNGFIEDYEEISATEQMGFWNVKIKAKVEHQKLLSKIKEIKLKPKKITGTKKLYAQIVSQVKTKFDAEDLFKKFYKEYTSVPIESYNIEITNFFIDTDLATRKTVPSYISWKIRKNIPQVVKDEYEKSYNLFKKISVGSYTGKETSVIGFFSGSNPSYPNEIKLYHHQHGWTTFGFPNSYGVIYPFKNKNGFGKHKRLRKGTITISILDKKGKVLKTFKKINLDLNLSQFGNHGKYVYAKSLVSNLTINGETLKSTYKYCRSFRDCAQIDYDELGSQIKWKMPVSLLKRVAQIKGEIIWK